MPREFRRYEPDQGFLLPPSLRDWLPEDHSAFFVSDAIDALDLGAFEARYETQGPGKQAFDPRMMVKVLVYSYATGTFSSRKIAAKLVEGVAFRVLVADNFPAHRTIADFRQRHLPEFPELFVPVVRMAREVGLVKLGTVAVDGTKVKAHVSKHKAMSCRRSSRVARIDSTRSARLASASRRARPRRTANKVGSRATRSARASPASRSSGGSGSRHFRGSSRRWVSIASTCGASPR
jgi:transposase